MHIDICDLLVSIAVSISSQFLDIFYDSSVVVLKVWQLTILIIIFPVSVAVLWRIIFLLSNPQNLHSVPTLRFFGSVSSPL